jgi:hypothetical protein
MSLLFPGYLGDGVRDLNWERAWFQLHAATQSLPSTLLPKLTYNSFNVFAVPPGLPLYFFAISHVKRKARAVTDNHSATRDPPHLTNAFKYAMIYNEAFGVTRSPSP